MSRHRSYILLGFIVFGFAPRLFPRSGATRGANMTFELEIPESNLTVPANGAATIPHPFVNRLLIRIKGPLRKIEHDKIYTRVNGEAANMVMRTSIRPEEVLCELDLNHRAGFRVRQGRNSVEVKVVDSYGRMSASSFLLQVGDPRERPNGVEIRSQIAEPGMSPPKLLLLTPGGPISRTATKVLFEGVIDHSEAGLALSIAGERVRLRPVDSSLGKRAIQRELKPGYGFRHTMAVTPEREEFRIAAIDGRGNMTEVIVPVYDPSLFLSDAGGAKYAVVIGVSRYRDERLNLKYARRDAAAFRDWLLSKGGFLPMNVSTLLDEDATSRNVRTALFTFLTRATEVDQVIIYFAGHGAPDPNNPFDFYFLPHDADSNNLGGTGLPMWQLRDLYARTLKTRWVVTFADACHSAGIDGDGDGRAVLTASDIGQLARESEAWGGGAGVFTHFLLKGLSGEADANRDSSITTGEVFDYVLQEVSRATGEQQTPVALPGSARELVLTGPAGS
jgi:hypothetical protein